MIPLKVKKFHEDAVIPFYAKDGDAGFDLTTTESKTVNPHESATISIGLGFEIPQGYEIQIRNRSGVTSKTPIRVQLGTIDSGYRGEVKVMVDNISDYPVTIEKGYRIAQGVVNKLPMVHIQEVEELGESERGAGGFGSTGTKVIDVTSKTDKQKEYMEVPKGEDENENS